MGRKTFCKNVVVTTAQTTAPVGERCKRHRWTVMYVRLMPFPYPNGVPSSEKRPMEILRCVRCNAMISRWQKVK